MHSLKKHSPPGLFARADAPALAACLLALSACTTTTQAPLKQEGTACGFLGSVCNQLAPGAKDQAALRYINPKAKWSQYQKVIIDPVTFWGADTTKVSGADQQTLVNFFHEKLAQEMGKKFEIVDKPGPGVMKLSVAILDAEAATPGLRTVSMVVPQAHMLSNLKYLATGTFPFVGGAQGAAKLSDAQGGEVLGAWVDRQIGGGSAAAGFQWQWGDAENALSDWSKKAAEKLSAWTTGAAAP